MLNNFIDILMAFKNKKFNVTSKESTRTGLEVLISVNFQQRCHAESSCSPNKI
jgi:hypothetical protein